MTTSAVMKGFVYINGSALRLLTGNNRIVERERRNTTSSTTTVTGEQTPLISNSAQAPGSGYGGVVSQSPSQS